MKLNLMSQMHIHVHSLARETCSDQRVRLLQVSPPPFSPLLFSLLACAQNICHISSVHVHIASLSRSVLLLIPQIFCSSLPIARPHKEQAHQTRHACSVCLASYHAASIPNTIEMPLVHDSPAHLGHLETIRQSSSPPPTPFAPPCMLQ